MEKLLRVFRETIVPTKQQATEWEKVFTNSTLHRRLISKTYMKNLTPGNQENK